MADFPVKLTGRHAGPQTIKAVRGGLIPHAFKPRLWYRQVVTIDDFAGAASTTQTLDLNALFTNNVFPTACDLLAGCEVRNIVLPVGPAVTALTIQVGGTFDAGADANGLMTASNLLGGGAAAEDILNTPAAANYAFRPESAFVPECLLTSTGANLSVLTAISFEVLIPWTPRTQVGA